MATSAPTRRIYSIDTSSFIALKNHYPATIFPGLWQRLNELAVEGRLRTCDIVRDECQDDVLTNFLESHADIVVPWPQFEPYLSALIPFLSQAGIVLTKATAVKTEADPFVIALALAIDGRSVQSIQTPGQSAICGVVVTQEKPGKANNIPAVCAALGLECASLLQFLQAEQYEG